PPAHQRARCPGLLRARAPRGSRAARRDRGAHHRFPRDRPHPPRPCGGALVRPSEAGRTGARAGDAAEGPDARRTGRRHEPRGDRGHGALHPRPARRMGRHRADGRARHGDGDGHLRPRRRAELRAGDRRRRALVGAERPRSHPRVPRVGRRGRAAPQAARGRRQERGVTFDWLFLFEISLAGLGTGGLYALTGLAFVMIYKATRVVNLAIGEMLMFGAYVFFAFAAGLSLPVWVAILAAITAGGLLGAAVERAMIRPMLGESPIAVFMVTVGLASILVGVVELIWTADPRLLPSFLPSEPIVIGEAFVSPKVFYGFLVAAALIAAVLAVFRF